jgi:hypothetical protein
VVNAVCFTAGKRPSIHRTGGWLGLQAILDGCRKSCLLRLIQIYLLLGCDSGVYVHGFLIFRLQNNKMEKQEQ